MANDRCEVMRRRRIKVTLGATAAAALVPALAYEGWAASVLTQCEVILRACLDALTHLSPAEFLPIALLLGGVCYALADWLRQRRQIRRLLGAHVRRATRPGEPLHALAANHGVLSRVILLEGLAPNPAFATGLLRPRIYISAALQQELSPSELRALFRHELWHVRRRDPLRFMALRFTGRVFFWLPLVRALVDDLIEEAELMADDFAAKGEDPLEVAGALVKVARRTAGALVAVSALRGLRPIERRVRRLLGERPRPQSVLPRKETLLSVIPLLALWALLAWGPTARPPQLAMQATADGAVHCPLCLEHARPGAPLDHKDCHLFL